MAAVIDPTPYQNKPGDSLSFSLVKLVGKQVKDIEGYISRDSGFWMFRVVFDDDSFMWTEGEHDGAYISTSPHPTGARFLVDPDDLCDTEEE